MKVIFFGAILISCFFSGSAFAVKDISKAQLEMRNPIHSSSEVIEFAKAALIKEHNVKIGNYKLRHLSFEYFNQWESNETKYAGEWNVVFDTSPPYPGSDFHVKISNSTKPIIEIIQGM